MATKQLRIITRASSQFPLIAVLEHAGFLHRAGLDVEIELVKGATPADQKLMDGKADFIFGSHISPYMHLSEGKPFVCLAQSVNTSYEYFVTREPITSLREVQDLRVGGLPLRMNEHGDVDHTVGILMQMLERDGVDLDRLDYVHVEGPAFEAVADGRADGAFVRSQYRPIVEAKGLPVLELPPLPMVNSVTLTTLWPNVERDEDVTRSLVWALAGAVRYFKQFPEETTRLLETHVAPRMGLQEDAQVRALYDKECARLDDSLFPDARGILNAFALAVRYGKVPDLEHKVNPMALWDLHYVRELHATGFFEKPLDTTAELQLH
jgi:ABC-type nitrate/sulfonate/bicarbonate transport system substrate-binding protein